MYRYLWCHQDHVDVLAEVYSVILHHTQQEAVAQAEGGTRFHGSKDAWVQLGLAAGNTDSSSGIRTRCKHECIPHQADPRVSVDHDSHAPVKGESQSTFIGVGVWRVCDHFM